MPMFTALTWLALSTAAFADEIPAAADAAPAEAVDYTLAPAKSWVYVVVRYDRDRWTPITAHDHVIKASTFDGAVSWNAADPSQCDIDIRFPVTALRVDPPGARERAKLDPDGAVDEGTKESIVKNMYSKMNLNYPTFGE